MLSEYFSFSGSANAHKIFQNVAILLKSSALDASRLDNEHLDDNMFEYTSVIP